MTLPEIDVAADRCSGATVGAKERERSVEPGLSTSVRPIGHVTVHGGLRDARLKASDCAVGPASTVGAGNRPELAREVGPVT